MKVTIIGAGVSGLTAAYFLHKGGFSVEVLEREPSAGGMIQSKQWPLGLQETAANAFVNTARLEQLAKEIGVVLEPTLKAARSRFIFRGKPRRWPLTFREALRLGRKAISTKVFSPDGFGARPQETIATWGERCLGKASVDYLLAPALGGIYAAPPSELSAGLILASLKEARKNAVGLKQKGSVAPQGGMGEFSEKLAHWLAKEGVLFRYMERVAAVVAEPGQKTVIATSLADSIELLHDSFPQASARLGALKRIPILSATVFLRKEEMAFAGFGCLFPRDQGFRALGVLSNTHIFPGRVTEHSETWIFRDEPGDSIVAGNDDAGLLDLIRRDRRKLANREAEFLDAKVSRWPNGIPCYDLALEEFLSSGVLDGLAKNGIFLHGNYLGRLGLSGIVDRSATFPRLIGA